MKKSGMVCGVLMLMVAGCKAKPSVSENSVAVAQALPSAAQAVKPAGPMAEPPTHRAQVSTEGGPQWGWQPYDEENFETQPSQGRVFSIPENATRLRVKLTASSPVDAAAMTRSVFKSAKGVVREDRLVALPCASIGVRQDEAKCELNAKDTIVYVVRDRRALSGDPAAMALLRQKAGGGVLSAMPADKVHVVLSVWACVANCALPGGPAQ